MASATGANLRELMRRMGQSSTRAALIYQHGSLDRDREIAKGIDRRARKATAKKPRKRKGDEDDGSAGLRVPVA